MAVRYIFGIHVHIRMFQIFITAENLEGVVVSENLVVDQEYR